MVLPGDLADDVLLEPGQRAEGVQDAVGSDTAAFKAGYSTVVPLIADYTAPEAIWGALRERLGRSFDLGGD